MFDRRRLAGDLPGTGSKTDASGVSDATWATAQPIAAVVTYESSYASGRKRILANNQASKSWICDCSVSMVNGLARMGALAAIGLPESMISAG